MKNELKRYLLAEYMGYTTRICESKKEYEELLKKINKYNSSKKSKRLCGNVSYKIINGKYHVIINEYNKLTPKMGITDLDNLTCEFLNPKELKEHYKEDLCNNHHSYISIVYLEDKNSKDKTPNDVDRGINSIDVLYKEDRKYLSPKYLGLCINYYIEHNDYGFFLDMANAFELNKCNSDAIFDLRTLVNDCRNKKVNLSDSNIIYIINKLYKSHILERNKEGIVLRDENGGELISRRRLRDFSFFIRNYNMKKSPKFMKIDYLNDIKEEENDEERYLDSIEEEKALDAWDQGRIYRR